ncbi:sensor domain-containing diguanylate cyclase [Noviherbaspirillum aerium]|uniref:sensor domain-containing diguanylate cyclase n=1 Tax=Noviherbaspirillum aerium TaxID=2588497 RepID=UPI00178C6C40|nr:sensor domain-containing diguanylate cyclase [Noviherbaspirillum aerium]
MITEQEDLFLRAFRFTSMGMALVTLDGRWLDANEAFIRLVGYTRMELKELTFQDITHPDDLRADVHLANQMVNGLIPSYQLDKRYLHRNGQPVWVSLTVSMVRDRDGDPDFLVVQASDISARKRVEAERDAFFDLSPDMLVIPGRSDCFERVNDRWTEVLGWSAQELTSRPFLDFVHPDDRTRTIAEARATCHGRPLRGFRNRYRHKDGDYLWLEWNTRLVGNGRLYCSARDVTAQQQVLERLRVQGDALRAASNGIVIIDPTVAESPIVYCNPAFERITGYGQAEVLGRNCRFLHRNDKDQDQLRKLNEAMAAGRECQVVLRNYRKSGQLFINELLMAPVRDKAGRLLNYVGILEDITERVRAQDELRHRELHLQQIMKRVPALIFQWHAHPDGRQGFNYISERCQDVFGVPARALMADWSRVPIHPEDMTCFTDSIELAIADRSDWYFEGRLLRPDGEVRWIKATSSPTEMSGDAMTFTGIVLDVTSERQAQEHHRVHEHRIRQVVESASEAFSTRKELERKLEQERQLLNTILETIDVGVKVCDANGLIVLVNRAARELSGIADGRGMTLVEWAEASGMYGMNASGEKKEMGLSQSLQGRLVRNLDLEVQGGQEARQVTVNAKPLRDGTGAIYGAVAVMSDVTELKAVEQQLILLARYDTLTGLPNRRHFDERLAEALARAGRSGQILALMVIDVDHFKHINDTHGHAGGDAVLREMAMRLKRHVRATDTVARLGGDEFVVILEGLGSDEEADLIAAKLVHACRQPIVLQDGEVDISISISIGIGSSAPGRDQDALMLGADKALYEAKWAGRNCFRRMH